MVTRFHGDSSRTYEIGKVDDKGQTLVNVTKNALEEAIRLCGPGVYFHEIGRVIELRCTTIHDSIPCSQTHSV